MPTYQAGYQAVHQAVHQVARSQFSGRLWQGLAVGFMASALIGCGAPSNNTATSEFETGLANHLEAMDAKMYGAFWCPHCQTQKAQFGAAVDQVPYVECAPEGENAQPQLCVDAGIEGYPTWEIEGELYPGTRSLGELAEISNYPGEIPEEAYAVEER